MSELLVKWVPKKKQTNLVFRGVQSSHINKIPIQSLDQLPFLQLFILLSLP